MTTNSLVARIAQRRGVRQFVKFGIVGTSGFLVNAVVFTVLQRLLGDKHYFMNFSIAFMTGGASNYFLNRVWTFRASGHPLVQGVQFLSVSAVALGVGIVVSRLAAPVLGPGHKTWLLATVAGMVVNFFVNKYWTFRSPA